jgi:uncharacterized membrane protein
MKKHLFAGLVILLPVVLTIFIILFLLNLFTAPLHDVSTLILSKLPEVYDFLYNYDLLDTIAKLFSLVLLCVFIFCLGVIARWFFINSLLSLANAILCKIPFVKSIYKTARDVIRALFPQKEEKKAFKRSVMVPFPSAKSQCVGFVSGDMPQECQSKVDTPLVPVFVPTTPYPISGYFMLVPEDRVNEINMTNEEAIKFTVSCGMITPEKKEKNEQ